MRRRVAANLIPEVRADHMATADWTLFNAYRYVSLLVKSFDKTAFMSKSVSVQQTISMTVCVTAFHKLRFVQRANVHLYFEQCSSYLRFTRAVSHHIQLVRTHMKF